ncbi:hypothetical protein AAFX19_15650 [Vibrio harveyi]|uniref:hypothetical protein n=1 Tax=Vibrio harveyi TaxID=669 RepID=UPI0009386EF1|nr:hypothetical protein [Vibrio harveyi]APP06745.1 hypothetical protein BG259_16110 [Vibrio harveyi]EKO3867623.1 hypothetical protein [Vibrio harveyi]
MQTARTQTELKDRIENFFGNEINQQIEVSEVISSLTESAYTYVFGGMLRDIGLFGTKGFESDIDLVFSGDKASLAKAIRKVDCLNYHENKFGGYRIQGLHWELDVWCAQDTWAIKKGHVKFDDISSLLNTTLMTWDSVLYCINDNKLIVRENYLDNLISRKLDIILEENPNKVGSLVRVLRAIYGKQAASLGPKAATLLANTLTAYKSTTLIEYEKQSFTSHFIDNCNLSHLKQKLSTYDGHGDCLLQD